MDSGRLVIRNPVTPSSGRPNQGRSAWRRAAEITEQTRGTGSQETGEGVSGAAEADTDTAGEVEPAGHFRIYLGAAPGVGKTYAMLSEGQRRRSRGADVVAGFVETYERPLTEALLDGLEIIALRYKAELELVYVIADDTASTPDRQPTDGLRELAADLGARWHEIQQDDPARAIIGIARQHEITQILIGPIHRSWPHIAVGGRIVRRVFEEAGASGIDVLIIARRELPPAEGPDPSAANES